jgi:ApeA N-terminal domain 1
MSGPESHSGVFWLADRPENRVFGTLDLSDGTPTLDLVDDLMARFEQGEVRQPGDEGTRVTGFHLRTFGPDVERFTIHGEIFYPRRHVTLLECFTRGYGDGQRLQASCALLDGHASEEIKISAARFGLPYLDEWAQIAKIEGSDDSGRIELSCEPIEPLTVRLPDPLSCVLEMSVEISKPQATWNGGHIALQASLTFRELPDVSLAGVWWGLAAISELYTLAIDLEARPTRLEIYDPVQDRWLQVVDPRLAREPEDYSMERLRRILLFRRDLDIQAFAEWVGIYEQLRPIPAVAVRSMQSAGSVLEVQLFELASAAEGFHRRRIDDTRISYDERLSQLLDRARPGMPTLAQWDRTAWKTRVKEARNGLAHRLPSYPGVPWAERWQEELAILKSLRWLITTLLLLDAGIESATLERRLEQHDAYRLFLEQAREWLHEVFPTAP